MVSYLMDGDARPRYVLLDPGPMQEAAAAEDEDVSFSPDTYRFLGADPTQYGLSRLDRQGPPEVITPGPSDNISGSETSEDELIEDCSADQPPAPYSITGDDDDDDELGEVAGSRSTGFLDWYGVRPDTVTYAEEGEKQ